MADEEKDRNQDGGANPLWEAAPPALIEAFTLIRSVCTRPGYAFSDPEVLSSLQVLQALLAVANATKLGFVQQLCTRPSAVPGTSRSGAMTFLTEGLNQSRGRAASDIAAAAAVASATAELPAMGQALADGQVSREHLDVAVSTIRKIPKALKKKVIDDADGGTATGIQAIDNLLTDEARKLPPTTIELLGRQILHRLDPSREEDFTPDSVERRGCTVGTDQWGMGRYHLTLDPVTHLQVHAAVTQHSAPLPAGTAVTPTGEIIQIHDPRSIDQRRVDAIADLILTGAATRAHQPLPTPTDPRVPTSAPSEPDTSEPDTSEPGTDADRTAGGADTSEPGTSEPGTDADRTAGGADAAAEASDDAAETVDAGEAGDLPDAGDQPDAGDSGEIGDSGEVGAGAGGEAGAAFRVPVVAVDLAVVATVDQVAAAFGAGDPGAVRAGLARIGLAGRIGTYPGATLTPAVLARLACDTPWRRIIVDHHGAVLHHGRARRLATTAQRRALGVRDGGCVAPGCPAPPEWADVHHVVPWEHGGGTDIDAMVLLCSRHHTAVHAGVYQLRMDHGVPWVRLPAWQHPDRPWLHNHTHRHHHLADQLAATLTDRPPPPRDPPDPWDACQASLRMQP